MLPLILIGELIALYFLSRWVTQGLFTLFLLIFRTRSVAVPILLILEFPGTVIHELSHLFTAEILGVRTGRMRLEPESIRPSASSGQGDITAGSVMIAESDPIRRSMIGLAPLSSGLLSLITLSYLLSNQNLFPTSITQFSMFNFQFSIISVIIYYLFFAISNTMFPSPQDMKGVWPVAIVLGICVGALYVFGLRIVITGQVLLVATRIAETLAQSLGLVVGVNIALWIITRLVILVTVRIMHVRIQK